MARGVEAFMSRTHVGGTVFTGAEIEAIVQARYPGAQVHPSDLTGGGDHWHVVVVSDAFEGMRSFQRQRDLMPSFKEHLATGAIHALDLRCLTPQELTDAHGGEAPAPFRPHGDGEGEHPGH